MDCSYARIASIIKMAILNHANHLPFNLQMGDLLLGTRINFFDCYSKDVLYILICNIVTTFILEKRLILKKEYVSTNQM